jgi:hypothetical protein
MVTSREKPCITIGVRIEDAKPVLIFTIRDGEGHETNPMIATSEEGTELNISIPLAGIEKTIFTMMGER